MNKGRAQFLCAHAMTQPPPQPPLPPSQLVWETTEELTSDERDDWNTAEAAYEKLLDQSRRAAAEQQAKLAAAATKAAAASDAEEEAVPINEALLSSWVPTRVTSDAELIAFSMQATAIAHTARRAQGTARTGEPAAGGALVIAGDPDAPPGEQLAMLRARYPLSNATTASVRALSFDDLTADLPYSALVADGGGDDAEAMHCLADWLTSVTLSEEPFDSLDDFVVHMLRRTRKMHDRQHSGERAVLCFYCSGRLFVHCALDRDGCVLRGFMFTQYNGGDANGARPRQ
jgi:hypothetical protein